MIIVHVLIIFREKQYSDMCRTRMLKTSLFYHAFTEMNADSSGERIQCPTFFVNIIMYYCRDIFHTRNDV